MQAPLMTKYGFRIRTRDGLTVDNLQIYGRDGNDAERKLRQMYHECEIIECQPMFGAARSPSVSFEDVARLIATR
ncbi:MAG TPA: hypothetical protein VF816_17785 [Rhodocyclaceae bacterium]